MKIKLACQTITWGENQSERFDHIFSTVKKAGYEGVEIGFRHIKEVPPEKLVVQLAEHGLVLVASHIGGNLEDRDQAGDERSVLDETLDYLVAAGCSRLLFSGLNDESADAVADGIAMLSRSAEATAQRGVRLLYHNHHWEFLRRGTMDSLLSNTQPSLGLCPDVGWLYRAGVDVMSFLKANASRIGALHFKDFATPGDGKIAFNLDTVPLGQGLVPLREVTDWLRTNPIQTDPLWVIAEQDKCNGSAEEAAILNGQFLNETLKGI